MILNAIIVSDFGRRSVDVTQTVVHLQAHVAGAYQWARYYRDEHCGPLSSRKQLEQQRYALMMAKQLLALRGVWEAI